MYKKLVLAIGFFGILFHSNAQLSDKEIDQKVDELLKKMTIEEKVGQMTQVTLNVICKTPPDGNLYHNLHAEIDDKKLYLESSIIKDDVVHIESKGLFIDLGNYPGQLYERNKNYP